MILKCINDFLLLSLQRIYPYPHFFYLKLQKVNQNYCNIFNQFLIIKILFFKIILKNL